MFENENAFSYAPVNRWGKKVAGGNAFALGKLIIPVNINNEHWSLCMAHVQERRIQYYDSMGGTGENFCNGLKRFLAHEAEKWTGKVITSPVFIKLVGCFWFSFGSVVCDVPQVDAGLLDVASWTVVGTATGTPRQLSCLDCGVFSCYFANFLSVGAPLSFPQADIPLFRRRMTVDTLRKHVAC